MISSRLTASVFARKKVAVLFPGSKRKRLSGKRFSSTHIQPEEVRDSPAGGGLETFGKKNRPTFRSRGKGNPLRTEDFLRGEGKGDENHLDEER